MLGYVNIPDETVKPQLQLCKNNNNRSVVGILNEAYNISQKITLGNINELSFYVPYMIESYHKLIQNPNIEHLYNRRIVKFIKGDYTEYYTIHKVSDVMEDEQDYKKVECYSLGFELRDKKIKDYKATSKNASYVLANLLYDTIWTIGYISSAFDIRFRSFDLTSSVLEAIQQVAEAFEAIIVYDTVKRQISLYNMEDIGQNKGLNISYGKLLKSITYESDGTDYCTRLKAFGRSGKSINGVNPTGSNFVEDYSSILYGFQRDQAGNVLSHARDISDSLAHAILNYSELVTAQTSVFHSLLASYETYTNNLSAQTAVMLTLASELAVIEDAISNAGYTGANPNAYITQKNAKLAQIASQQAVIDRINTQIAAVNGQIAALQNNLSLSNNFTAAQLHEWNPWIIVEEFSNENYSDAKELYAAAQRELEKRREPRISASVDIVNFLEIITEYRDWDKLVLGDVVHIEHDKLGVHVTAKIIELNFNYESGDVQLTISNVKDILTDQQKFIKSLYKTITSSAAYDRNKYELSDTVTTNSEIYQTINSIWDATDRGITASNNNSVTMDRKGIRIHDPTDPLKVLIAQNGVLAISADGGNHWRTALRYDGLVAENVRGILGEFVTLYANQIAVSPSGAKIPDSVVSSAAYWNSVEGAAAAASQSQATVALNAAKVYADTNLITANTYASTVNTAIRTDLRLAAPLPSSITLNAYGITATTSDPLKFARLESRGLYVQGGAVQIVGAGGQTYIDDTGIKAPAINAGTMTGVESTIGTGNNVFKASSQGIQLGHTLFSSSPFRVDMFGNLVSTNADVKGAINCDSFKIAGVNVLATGGTQINGNYIDKITTNQIVAGTAKIGTALIENLVVGGNVTMGPSASVSWATQVTGKPAIPSSAADVGAVAANQTAVFNTLTNSGAIKGLFMQNGQLYVNADFLNAGTIKGIDINGTNITGTSTITGAVVKTATSGARLQMDSGGIKSYNSYDQYNGIVITNSGNLDIYYLDQNRGGLYQSAGTIHLENRYVPRTGTGADLEIGPNPTQNPYGKVTIQAGQNEKTYAKGNWDFYQANVTGITAKWK